MTGREKKQLPLRIGQALFAAVQGMADDDFRSVNGEVEYLLTECAKKRGYLRVPPADEAHSEKEGSPE